MTTEIPFKFGLGDKVKDIVSGFTGIVIAQIRWLNGCRRYQVAPNVLDKDGQPGKNNSFDEGELQLEEAGLVKPIATKPPGGPQRGEAEIF